jgi:hypothetical protein
MSVFERLSNAYAINTEGGPHVTFARGNACPDDIVNDFLVNDVMPEKAVTECDGELVGEYAPVAPADARDYKNALEAMISLENEITNALEFYYWDAASTEAIGCDRGGVVEFSIDKRDERLVRFMLDECIFSSGFVFTGDGSYDLDKDRWTFNGDVNGNQTGSLRYTRDGDDYRVTGTLDGQPVNLRR